ncbi:allophanate hydrolase subunit 1 [Francisellaceae bacterium]|nr:allophanate hydrolase subunit 1 [Francisellaceae bacterium]
MFKWANERFYIMKSYFLNESNLVIELGNKLNRELNNQALLIYYYFVENKKLYNDMSIIDIVPTYNSIAFHFYLNPESTHEQLKKIIISKVKLALSLNYDWQQNISEHQINVRYDGMDIDNSIKRLNLSKTEFIKLHTEPTYQIAMLGFKPYLPYLLGLDEKLAMPRLESPRTRIPAGSIGIGGSQSSIFPVEMPCGWHIIGSSDFKDFKKFKPGDRVKFISV